MIRAGWFKEGRHARKVWVGLRAGRCFMALTLMRNTQEALRKEVIVGFETGPSAHVAIRHRTLHRPRKGGPNAEGTSVLGADEQLTRQGWGAWIRSV